MTTDILPVIFKIVDSIRSGPKILLENLLFSKSHRIAVHILYRKFRPYRTKSNLFYVSPERTSHQLQITFRPLLRHYGHKSEKVQLWILHPNGLVERQKTKHKGSILTSFKQVENISNISFFSIFRTLCTDDGVEAILVTYDNNVSG